MNFLSLQYFLIIAERGVITQAAAELHITQPALTRHVAQLERELGVKLLMRHGRGVRLTEAGQLLQIRGKAILADVDRLSDDLVAQQSEPRGSLAIGLPYAWSETLTAPVVKRFNARFPDVQLTVIADSSETLESMLKAQYIDFAVLTTNENDQEVAARPIVHDRVYLFGQKGSGLAELDEISLADLAERPTIRQHNAVVASKRTDQRLARFGRSQNVLVNTSSSMMLELADLGLGYVVMAGCATGSRRYEMETVPIVDHSITWTIGTLRTRPVTAAMTAFEALLTAEIRERAASGEWPGVVLIEAGLHQAKPSRPIDETLPN
ncbi:LysR family transcriptional regulator [Rhodococcus koreensis]|jgi:LysR family nitrogen assimilation transcriptional regulator|uniref:LysR family transcriptional regulator n=1 Tax=Rhodococcus koreensis TaxID=99653 RepID=UPI001981199C|nr:LysR family transcriptional regulator [Rhodococcus koreensis]QSE86722.1 LysR family transcriptional regulator [Rhodococcus koreensis]